MDKTNPSYFFDLTAYKHAALFDPKEFVWQALDHLESYLRGLPLGNIQAEIPQGAFLVDPHLISIGKGTIVEPGSYIKGPCFIGENCTIRQGAYIRGNLVTGNKCVIGHDTEIKHAILLDGAHAAHFAYVGDTILGNRVNLGAGTKCANFKFNHQHIVVFLETQRLDSGRRKFGAIIGDDSQLGCNTVTNPGTLLGKSVWCYPCVNIGGFVPSDSIVKSEEKISISKRLPRSL